MEEQIALLEKYLAGACTEEELRWVSLMDGTKRRKILLKLIAQREEKEFNAPLRDDPAMKELVNARWQEIQRHIAASKNPSRRPFLTRSILRWGSLAAVFAGILILSGVFLWNNSNDTGFFGNKEQAIAYAELSNPGGIPELHQLPDGTKIWLAAGSTLKYPEQFSKKHRDVELTGEAFFDVARDEARPFTIRMGKMQTRVLGTSFKVTAFSGQEQVVAVATGKVRVSNEKRELALLTRGLQVRHNPATGATAQTEIDPSTLEQWKTGTLIFDELPMSLVAEQLENRYGITIEFADSQIATRRVRGVFTPDDSVASVLSVLGFVGNFQYKSADNKQYTIYKPKN